jgi:hypothetical protein
MTAGIAASRLGLIFLARRPGIDDAKVLAF